MRVMLTATHSQMNFIENDEAIGLGFQVFDEKTQAFVDPAPVLERLAKKRAEERIKAATAPVVAPPDEDKPTQPSRRKTTTFPKPDEDAPSRRRTSTSPNPDEDTPTQPSRRTTTSPSPGAGGSDSPSTTSPTTTVRRETPPP